MVELYDLKFKWLLTLEYFRLTLLRYKSQFLKAGSVSVSEVYL